MAVDTGAITATFTAFASLGVTEQHAGMEPAAATTTGASRLSCGTRKIDDGVIRHLGNHEFFPIGAEFVRIRFAMVKGRASAVGVFDPAAVVNATRVA